MDELDFLDEDDGDLDHTFLTFRVGEEEYAVAVAYVTEIVRWQKTYVLPDVPEYIRGVINLRGKIVALLDVRSRFGVLQPTANDRNVVVVLEVGEVFTGLVVDAVLDVAHIPPEQIELTSAPVGQQRRGRMVSGIGKRADGVAFIIDVESLLDRELEVDANVVDRVAASERMGG